jgi:hypothetical protein
MSTLLNNKCSDKILSEDVTIYAISAIDIETHLRDCLSEKCLFVSTYLIPQGGKRE